MPAILYETPTCADDAFMYKCLMAVCDGKVPSFANTIHFAKKNPVLSRFQFQFT